MPKEELAGRSVWGLLTDHDAALLRDRTGRGDRNYEEPLLLNFVDARHTPFTIECHCGVQRDPWVLCGPSRTSFRRPEMASVNVTTACPEDLWKRHEGVWIRRDVRETPKVLRKIPQIRGSLRTPDH